MTRISIALLAVTTLAGGAMATERPGALGPRMQDRSSVKGSPGASGYTRGHEIGP